MGLRSILGGAAGQTAKELGAPEWLQELSEIIGITSPDIKNAVSALQSVEKTKEKSGLILPRVVENTKEGWQFLKGKVFSKANKKAYENVSKQAETLLDSMKGIAVKKLSEFIKEIRRKGKLNKIFWITNYPRHSERNGFKRSKNVLMEYNEEKEENKNGKNSTRVDSLRSRSFDSAIDESECEVKVG